MQLVLDIQAEKVPFILELVQQLDGVAVVRMENEALTDLAQPLAVSPRNISTANDKLDGEVGDLQDELDELFGR